MRTTGLLSIVGSFCFILVLAAGIPFTAEGGTPAPPPKPITIRVAFTETPTSITYLSTVKCAKNIETRSNGRLHFEFYPTNQLVPADQVFEALKSGAIDMNACYMGLFVGIEPMIGGLQLPFGYISRDHGWAAWQAGLRELLEKAVVKHNQKILALSCPTSRGSAIFTRKFSVKVPTDLKGHKIRVAGPDQSQLIAGCGGAPVTMPASEYYEALGRGTIEGVITGVEMSIARSLYEVVDNMCLLDFDWGLTYYAMNLDLWNKLSPDLQALLVEEFGEKYWKVETDFLPEYYDAAIKKYQAAKVAIYDPIPAERVLWRDLTKDTVSRWTTKVGEPGKKWLDVIDKTRPK